MWLLSDKASLVTGAVLNVMGAQRYSRGRAPPIKICGIPLL